MNHYRDRRDAGQRLATLLALYTDLPNVIVLGLPRGGVPVAAEVARALHCPLEVFLVRKLGVPGHEEFAMGAVAEGNVVVEHEDVMRDLRIPREDINAIIAREQVELRRRADRYRPARSRVALEGRVAIVVDDGLATGATMEAAIAALRQLHVARVVVAVPVGAPDSCARVAALADELVCPLKPHRFSAVGAWYDDFAPTTDAEIGKMLTA